MANIIFVVAAITFKMTVFSFKVASVADKSLLVVKITFAVSEIITKKDVITS